MKKALIIDDDSIARWAIMQALEKRGIAPYGASCTDDAILQIELMRGKFDIILLDIMLPKNTGVQYAQVLRCDSRFKDCPIILISSGVSPDTDKRLKKLLKDDTKLYFLAKPINANLLGKILNI
ncbi:MAG: response regulator [Desulfobacterales bacterium]|nr:response regulator [Desulfobacterales bacterium]